LFTKYGGHLGEAGCVGWMFQKRGVLLVDAEHVAEESVIETALEAGADDVAEASGSWEVTTSPETFEAVREALVAAGLEPTSAEVAMMPSNTVHVGGQEAGRLLKLLEALEDQDDVQNVSANADIDEDEVARLSA
jgi:transcriptional/translational regulatory protein YebC/TACO1